MILFEKDVTAERIIELTRLLDGLKVKYRISAFDDMQKYLEAVYEEEEERFEEGKSHFPQEWKDPYLQAIRDIIKMIVRDFRFDKGRWYANPEEEI